MCETKTWWSTGERKERDSTKTCDSAQTAIRNCIFIEFLNSPQQVKHLRQWGRERKREQEKEKRKKEEKGEKEKNEDSEAAEKDHKEALVRATRGKISLFICSVKQERYYKVKKVKRLKI